MKNRKAGQPVKNRFKVPKKMWESFSNHAKAVFNNVFHSMRPSLQWGFKHPEALIESSYHWNTTRWNAAVTAAWAADGTPALTQIKNVPVSRRIIGTKRKKKHVK